MTFVKHETFSTLQAGIVKAHQTVADTLTTTSRALVILVRTERQTHSLLFVKIVVVLAPETALLVTLLAVVSTRNAFVV